MVRSRKKETFLQIVPVVLHSELGEDVETYALLDDGSQSTLLRDDIAERLHLNGKPQDLKVSTVIQKAEQSIPSKSTTLTVYSRKRDFKLEIEDVSVVPAKCFNMPSRPRLEDSEHFTHQGFQQRGVLGGPDPPPKPKFSYFSLWPPLWPPP